MIQIEEKDKCSGCYACASICPMDGCISMQKDEEGFCYPQINSAQCINCRACEKVCPMLSSIKIFGEKKSVAFAAINNIDEIRKDSSSGGIFSILAAYVLEQGGVVFGAAFDDSFNVVHKYIENIEDLEGLRGSKYVQSQIGNTYNQAKEFLERDRLVYFSGTPCQIAGLVAYLKKPYSNLITQDLICHGVPSPMVWEKYIEYRQFQANGAKPQKIAFRAKDEGWKRYSVKFLFENNTEYRNTLNKDPYMKVFLKDLCLRPSCYNCSFKTKNRLSDITLADFWGIQEVFPEMDDDKGVSLIILHSDKGKEIFEAIRLNLSLKEVDVDLAISYNPAMLYSAKVPESRKIFMEQIYKKDFKFINKKYCQPKTKEKVKNMLRKIKYKLFRRKK